MSKSQFPKKRKLGCRTQLRARETLVEWREEEGGDGIKRGAWSAAQEGGGGRGSVERRSRLD